MNEDRLLRVHEVADRLALCESTIRSWLSQGKLPKVKVGSKSVRIPLRAVEDLIRRGTKEDAPVLVL